MSFLEPRLGFPWNLASLFSVMRHSSSILFHLNLHMLWTKEAHQSANFQVFDISHENQPNTYFSSHESFSFKFCITLQCHNIFSLKFSSWNIICFWQKNPINVHFFGLLSAPMIVHSIPHAIFENTGSGYIQNLHHCSVPWKIIPLYYFSSNLIYFGQKEAIRVKFLDFWVVGWKFTKFLKSYLKPQVSFSLNFASLFNVMKDHSSVLF